METPVVEFLKLSECSDVVGGSEIKKPYVSYIKIHGKPILPPLIDDEKRKELQKFKQKAIEIEKKVAKIRKKNNAKNGQISREVSSIVNITPSRHSTPARPSSLNLMDNVSGKTLILSKSRIESCFNKYIDNTIVNSEILSSHKSAKNLDRSFRSTLEQRLATEDDVIVRNKLNKCQQSPIIEEYFPDKLDSSRDSRSEKKSWSPLQIDSINSLKIELPTKDTHETDDNLDISLDESQNTPDTVTQSPNLMRQNSYTLLTPSPALLQFLESQKDQETAPRTHSGRKTWDLRKAKKNWDPNNGALDNSSDEEECKEKCDPSPIFNKKVSSSNDSLSAIHDNSINEPDYSLPNSLAYDSGTSPESYNSNRKSSSLKTKSKLKGKKVRSTKSVPSPVPMDTVPFKDHSKSMQGSLHNFTSLRVSDSELSDLSNLLLKMKVDYERQKRELEEKQQSEMKKLEFLFQKKEAELLSKVSQMPKKCTKSIYTQSSRDLWCQELGEGDPRVIGDWNQRKDGSVSEHYLGQLCHGRRPHSAKDFHSVLFPHGYDGGRRTRSMDFNQGNQDTDLDVSFQDDFPPSRDTTLNNEYIIESDSMSNFSSHSSTVSSENRRDLAHVINLKKFQGISIEEFAKYNQAALKITAAARGFLTRRLLRTAHVQGLITTLRDAINCATQLHTAPDIADSDIDLMRRLSRQIEAAWDAVYSVFFNTETSAKLQLIAADRERLKAATTKLSTPTIKKKRISAATRKSLDRKKGGSVMSKSQTSNGFSRVRMCTKMAASYPSPYFPKKLK